MGPFDRLRVGERLSSLEVKARSLHLPRTDRRLALPAAIGLIGVILVGTGIYLAVSFTREPAVVLEHPGSSASLPQQAVASLADRLQQISPYARSHQAPARPAQPRRGLWIQVPAVGIDLPVAEGDGSNNIPYWKTLIYPGSAYPGTAGNSYVYAHGIWGMFGGLLLTSPGEHVYLHDYTSGRVDDFVISRVVGKVAYNDMRWLEARSSTPLLTLQTCIGWDLKGDRFVVLASPAGGAPA